LLDLKRNIAVRDQPTEIFNNIFHFKKSHVTCPSF
jgi:hypothetical protein